MSSSTFKLPPRSVWGAVGLVGKAAESKSARNTDPQSSPPLSLRPTAVWAPLSKRSWRRSLPEDQQARASWLQEAMRRISCVLQIHNARIIANATDPSDPLFARLSLAHCALFLAPVLCDPCLLAW